jgi:hydroxypyruvate reductase
VLVSSGAAIREINAVRQTFSAVKAGALAERAPDTDQITFIVSDTNVGEEACVASGPTLKPPNDSPRAIDVITRYNLLSKLPRSILECGALALSNVGIARGSDKSGAEPPHSKVREHYVLLENRTALNAAALKARELGYTVAFADDLLEQPIEEGCERLIARLKDEWLRQPSARPFCLLSGGEFACPVKGDGVGGRNLETALRCAAELSTTDDIGWKHVVILSSGTDGIDGNSPAAGAITDETTISQAHSLGLNPGKFLEQSDSFSLLQALQAVIFTGPTGTNVRDLRVLLAC